VAIRLITREMTLEDGMSKAEFDSDQLESFMVAAFELLGKPETQAQELAKAILKAAEWRPVDDQESSDRGQMRHFA
jgi:hypothetical protein